MSADRNAVLDVVTRMYIGTDGRHWPSVPFYFADSVFRSNLTFIDGNLELEKEP